MYALRSQFHTIFLFIFFGISYAGVASTYNSYLAPDATATATDYTDPTETYDSSYSDTPNYSDIPDDSDYTPTNTYGLSYTDTPDYSGPSDSDYTPTNTYGSDYSDTPDGYDYTPDSDYTDIPSGYTDIPYPDYTDTPDTPDTPDTGYTDLPDPVYTDIPSDYTDAPYPVYTDFPPKYGGTICSTWASNYVANPVGNENKIICSNHDMTPYYFEDGESAEWDCKWTDPKDSSLVWYYNKEHNCYSCAKDVPFCDLLEKKCDAGPN